MPDFLSKGNMEEKKNTIFGIPAAEFKSEYSLSDICTMLIYGDEEDKKKATEWLEQHKQCDC